MTTSPVVFLGLRTVIYPAPDLDSAKRWWTGVLGVQPYFDEPFYVGFNVAGYELALDPRGSSDDGPITYWGVDDVDDAVARLLASGAEEHTGTQDVGGGIRVAVVRTPSGSPLGLIRNPHF